MLNPALTYLTSTFSLRLKASGGVDVLLFNPPYVPTDLEEADEAQEGRDIEGAWAGGADGMQVTERVLRSLKVVATFSFFAFWFANQSMMYVRIYCPKKACSISLL